MRDCVLSVFDTFNAAFESRLPFLYLDVDGNVTAGIGDLMEPVGTALAYQWKRPDGTLAGEDEVRAAWELVKSRQDLAKGGGVAFGALTTLRLPDSEIERMVTDRRRLNEQTIRVQFPGYDTWPGDAQLAIHSMAWQQGPGFAKWPKLRAALRALDFMTAAGRPGDAASDPTCRGESWIRNGSLKRNLANKTLFQNAARVFAVGLDADRVYYPAKLPPTAMPTPPPSPDVA